MHTAGFTQLSIYLLLFGGWVEGGGCRGGRQRSKTKEVKFGVEMLLLNMDTAPTSSAESVLAHRYPASAAEGDLVQRRNTLVWRSALWEDRLRMGLFFPQQFTSFCKSYSFRNFAKSTAGIDSRVDGWILCYKYSPKKNNFSSGSV